jgi:hypothetical protein
MFYIYHCIQNLAIDMSYWNSVWQLEVINCVHQMFVHLLQAAEFVRCVRTYYVQFPPLHKSVTSIYYITIAYITTIN